MREEIVKVSDKEFRLLYDSSQIKKRVEMLAGEISRDMAGSVPVFVCMLKGSFMFAADLLRHIDCPCEVSFIRYSSYRGTHSTGKVRAVMGLDTDVRGRNIVVVEDIVETGRTMYSLLAKLNDLRPASVSVAALVTKPDRLEKPVEVKYAGFKMKATDFIVGYGLDYNEQGRNLSDIYILNNQK